MDVCSQHQRGLPRHQQQYPVSQGADVHRIRSTQASHQRIQTPDVMRPQAPQPPLTNLAVPCQVIQGPSEAAVYRAQPGQPMTQTVLSRGQGFQLGDRVEYNSTSRGGWVAATVLRRRASGTYDLDVRQGAESHRIRAIQASQQRIETSDVLHAQAPQPMLTSPVVSCQVIQGPSVFQPVIETAMVGQAFNPGDRVEYYSTSSGGWVPATVVQAHPTSNTYDLDVRQGAEANRIRAVQTCHSRALQTSPTVLSQVVQGPSVGQPVIQTAMTRGQAFNLGDRVEYYSSSSGGWVAARVLQVHPTFNTYDLDVRHGAPANRIRAAQSSQQRIQTPGVFSYPSLTVSAMNVGSLVPRPPGTSTSYENDEPIEETQSSACGTQSELDISEGGPLTIATRVEYSSLPRGQARDTFGLVTIQALDASALPSGREQERQAMDLVCVLDVSGSMEGIKLEQLKDAVQFIISQADPRDRLSIATFNDSASLVMPLKRMTAAGKKAANRATQKLVACGGTFIAGGLQVAYSVMEQRRQQNKVSAILLLTDGQDSSTQMYLPEIQERATLAKCGLYAFGFGADHDAGLLNDIAESAHTPFTFVEDTDKISEAFAGTVGGLCGVVAQGVELTLDCAVELKTVLTPFAVRREGNNRAVVTIPDVFASERRDVLVELAVPAASEEELLLRASLRYTDLRQGVVRQSLGVEMRAARSEEPQPEPDEEVSDQRRRVDVTKALRCARAKGDEGNFKEAQRVLVAAEQRLSAESSRSPYSSALCQELSDARSRMCSRSAWESGGRATVCDAAQMHSVQRNVGLPTTPAQSMYCSPTSMASIYVASVRPQSVS